MKLLISPKNTEEAREAISGGADIIDVKNPVEGPLGANFPWVIKEIRELLPVDRKLSCTLGEAPNLPGSISLAAYGAASLGVHFIKVGLYGLRKVPEVVSLLENVNRAAKECNSKIKIVAAGYADYMRANTIPPLLIPEAAVKAQVDYAMLDTAVKDGKNLFDFLSESQLKQFVDCAHDFGLGVALAGSLRKQDLPVLNQLGSDIAGLRGAACMNENRVTGRITREKVRELSDLLAATGSIAQRF